MNKNTKKASVNNFTEAKELIESRIYTYCETNNNPLDGDIEEINIGEYNIRVSTYYKHCGSCGPEYGSYTMPTEYFLMSDSEFETQMIAVKKDSAQKLKDVKEKEEQDKKKQREERKKLKEEKELKKYQELKKKFEGDS